MATDPDLPIISDNIAARTAFIKEQRSKLIQPLALDSKRKGAVPDLTVEPTRLQYEKLRVFLRWLDQQIEITPLIKKDTQIDAGLKIIFDNPSFHFSEEVRESASLLFAKWESQRWGGRTPLESMLETDDGRSSSDGAEDAPAQRPTQRRRRDLQAGHFVNRSPRRPPPKHPIWGKGGIMEGMVLKHGARQDYIWDGHTPKRDPRKHGHNGIAIGQWYAKQCIAFIRGAHGSLMAGIAGSTDADTGGAWSIVISGKYDDLDTDHGDVVYYSGSGSHENDNPRAPAQSTHGTNALHASLGSRKPVRVLRAAQGRSRFAPACGIRYDGLYRVASLRTPLNSKGGMYEQFKLVRLENQGELPTNRPTAREVYEFGKIKDGY